MARTFAGFSARPFSGRLAVGASRQGGGYDRADTPDVNDPVNAYKLMTGATPGQHTAPQFGTQPAVQNRLTENLDLSQRAGAFDAQTADAERHERRGGSMMNPYLKDKRFSALFQALQEAGADRMQTGARAGWEQPGFYDTQATMGADAQGRQQLLEALLMNQGRPQDASFVRGIR